MITRKLVAAVAACAVLLSPCLARAQDVKIASINLGAGPFTEGPTVMAVDGSNGFAYVFNEESNDVMKIDIASDIVTAVLPLPAVSGCGEGGQLAISDLGGGHHHLWLLRGDNQLIPIEITPASPFNLISGTGSLGLPSIAEDMVVDNLTGVNTLFLACPSTDQIVAIKDSTSHGTSIGPTGFSPVALSAGSKPSRLAIADTSGVPDRLFIAPRGASTLLFFMDTMTGANGSLVLSLGTPPYFAQDVAFDGDPTSGRIYASVRYGSGDAICEVNPVSQVQTTCTFVSSYMGVNQIDDVAAMRIPGASKVVAVRSPQFGSDGGASVVCTFPQPPTAGPGPVGFTIPPGIELRTSSQNSGPSSGGRAGAAGIQNIAMDPVNQRIYVTHARPFHVHIFDVAGTFLGELNPSGPEEGEDSGVVTANVGGTQKVFVTQDESNFVAIWVTATILGNPNNPPPDAEVIPPGHINNACVDPATNKLVVTSTNKDLTVVDLATHALSTITLPGPLFGNSGCDVHPTAGFVFVGNGRKGVIHAVHLNSGTITTVNIPFPAGEVFAGIAVDKTTGRAYIGSVYPSNPSAGSGSLFVVDMNFTSGSFMTVINTFLITSGGFPCDFTDIVVDRNTGIVYAIDGHGLGSGSPTTSRIFKINGATGAVTGTTTVPRTDADHGPDALAINPTTTPVKLYVGVSANNMSGSTPPSPFIRILDGGTLAQIGSDITVAMHAHFHEHGGSDDDRSMVVEEITGRLYVSIGARSDTTPVQNAAIEVISSANVSETTLSFGPPGACSEEDRLNMVLNRVTGRLFATSDQSTNLFRFDGITPVTTPTLTTAGKSAGLRVNPNTRRVYAFSEPNILDVFAPAPTISTFSPGSGAAGASLSISGSGFTGATSVLLNGTAMTFSVMDDATISATVPTGATSGAIQVIGPAGSATSASTFTVSGAPTGTPPPVISSFSPPSGGPGASVDIFGSGFTGATSVAFNGVAATFSASGDTAIFTSVPSGATSGPITVTGPGGTATSAGSFVVIGFFYAPGTLNPGPSSALAGASQVPLLQFLMTASGDDFDLGGLTIATRGSGNFASGAPFGVLWVDNNGNGVTDALDTLIGSASISGGSASLTLATGPGAVGRIARGTSKTFLFTTDLTNSAAVGETFGILISNFSAVGSSGGAASVSALGSTSGSLVTVAAPAGSASSSVQGGTSVNDFIMFAASIDTGSTGFQQVESQFGPTGSTGDWRLFRFDPTTGLYDEFGSTEFTSKYPIMDPAFGWWFIARNAGALSFTGTSTAVTDPNGFSITIPPGWSQVGNPYSAPLPLALVEVNGTPFTSSSNAATLPSVYFFSSGSYIAETATMLPRQGYWMKNVSGSSASVLFERPPTALKAGEGQSQTRRLAPGEETPPAPPSLGGGTGLASGGGGGGGGGCFAVAGGTAGLPWGVLGLLGAMACSVRRLTRSR